MKRKDGQSLVYILAVLLAVNLIGFWQCYSYKRRAKKKRWRIPEKTFFITAFLGGGIGVWTGMYLFRHKTKHWYFVVFIPLITIVEYGLAIWLFYKTIGF